MLQIASVDINSGICLPELIRAALHDGHFSVFSFYQARKVSINVYFPVRLVPAAEGGYVVSFPDIPEVLTQGETRQQSLDTALEALVTAFEFYFEDSQSVPLPSPVKEDDDFVEVPLSVASKVLLLNAFLASKISQQELAKRIGRPKQEITRLFDLRHATKIDAVQTAARALGKELSLTLS